MKERLFLALALSATVAISAPIPAFAQDAGMQPDNTRQNKEMRRTGTAEQQRETPADRKMSARIRKAVTKDKGLSHTARNIKIITRDGMVTLKGPVKSEEEKQAVEQLALKVAGEGKVTNELTVTPPKK